MRRRYLLLTFFIGIVFYLKYYFNIVTYAFVAFSIYQALTYRRFFKINKVILVIIQVGLLVNVYMQANGFRSLEFGTNAIALLTMFKFLECRGNKRDYYIFLNLLLLMGVGNVLMADTVLNIAYSILMMILYTANIILLSGGEQRKQIRIAPSFLVKSFFSTILIVIILFVVFPRIEVGSIFSRQNFVQQTGFSGTLEPGSVSKLIKDDKEMMQISTSELINIKKTYWRGRTLIMNKGLSWRFSNKEYDKFIYQRKINNYRVSFESPYSGPLFLLDHSKNVRLVSKFGVLQRGKAETKLLQMGDRKPIYDAIQYEAKVSSNFDESIYLQTAVDPSENVKKLISDIKSKANGAKQISKELLNWFGSNGFRYSLEPGKYGKNFQDKFLFQRKVGFCEHYASMFALLLRWMEIPSRVVVGFQGGEYNQFGNYYKIKSSDAHAWVEFWNGRRWERIDPVTVVAPERFSMGGQNFTIVKLKRETNNVLLRKVTSYFEGMAYSAAQFFLSFDLQFQREFFQKLFNRYVSIRSMIIFSIILSLIIALIYFFVLEKIGRRKRNVLDVYFDKFCLKISKEKRPSYEGPQDYFYRISKHLSNFSEARDILENYLQLRYSLEYDKKAAKMFIKTVNKFKAKT